MVDFSVDLGNLLVPILLAVTKLIEWRMQGKSRNETREIRRRLKNRKRPQNPVRRLRDKVNRKR